MHLRMSELLREWGCNLEKGGRELIVRSTTVRHSYSHVFQFNQHTYLWRLSSSFNTSVMKFTPSLHLIAPGLLRFDHPTLVQTVFDHPVFPSRLHLNTAVSQLCLRLSPPAGAAIGVREYLCMRGWDTIEAERPSQCPFAWQSLQQSHN